MRCSLHNTEVRLVQNMCYPGNTLTILRRNSFIILAHRCLLAKWSLILMWQLYSIASCRRMIHCTQDLRLFYLHFVSLLSRSDRQPVLLLLFDLNILVNRRVKRFISCYIRVPRSLIFKHILFLDLNIWTRFISSQGIFY